MTPVAPVESYGGISRRWRRASPARPRGFRLVCSRNRFSVRRLRAKVLTLLGLVGRYARLLVRRLSTTGGSQMFPRSSGGARGGTVVVMGGIGKVDGAGGPQRWSRRQQVDLQAAASKGPLRAASFMRTNSFYAQAIADCLEFIKRNSVPVEDFGVVVVGGAAGR